MKKNNRMVQWNTVTTFSKYLALTLFIVFPFLGFYLGVKYQPIAVVSKIEPESVVVQDTYTNLDREYVLDGYYYAKDLGIKFKLSPEIQKQILITRVSDEFFDGPVKWLNISTLYLATANSSCSLKNGALGSLWRGEGAYRPYPSNVLIKQFETFFIAYNNGGHNCASESDAIIQNKLQKEVIDFDNSIIYLVEISTN